MTVSTQPTFKTYAGAGLAGPFPIPFRFTANSDVVVKKISAAGVVSTLTGNTITGAGEALGGSLNTAAVVASGETLLLYRDTPRTQPADYTASDDFPAEVHEGALDRAIMILQEVARDLARTIRVPMGSVGLELAAGAGDGVLTLEGGLLVITPLEDIAGEKGDKGDPGAGASNVGPFAAIAVMTIPAGTNRITATGFTAEHDCPAFDLIDVTGDAVTLASDTTSNAAARKWRIAGDQPLRPEFCGAVGDAELVTTYYATYQAIPYAAEEPTNTPTDDTAAFVKFFDLLNYWNSFDAKLTPGRNYFFAPVSRASIGYVTKTVTLHDGRTCAGKFISTSHAVPLAVCWNGFTFDCTGAKIILDGDFNLASSDYLSGYMLRDTLLPFNMWKCRMGRFINRWIDGQWRHQTTDTGGSGECFSYATNLIGCAHLVFENDYLFDLGQDGFALGHRSRNLLGDIALSTVERFPEPDQSDADTYDPDGRCQNIAFFNPTIGPCRRQGTSVIGVGGRDLTGRYPGLTVVGGLTRDIGRYIGSHPKWQTGDTTDGSTKWQRRGFPPRLAFDIEPQGAGPYQADGIKLIGHRMEGCIGGFVGAPGDWGLNRVEQSVPAAGVNVATNTFTKTALTLPGCYEGQLPNKIRLWNDAGDPPEPLQPYTDYYIHKTASTAFQLCATYADAVAGNPIDLVDAGTGTTWFVYHNSTPNVGTIDVIDCTGLHPWDGSLAPWQVTCERLTISGGVYENKSGTAFFGPSQANREHTVWNGVEFTSVRNLLDVDSYVPKSGVTFAAAGSTVTYAGHGIGKYEYTPVRFKSGGALPPEVERSRTYYATRIDDDTFKLSVSETTAQDGAYLTFTSAGTGTHIFWKFNLSKFNIDDCGFTHAPRDLSFDALADVDTTNNRIRMPMGLRQDGIANAEAFRIRPTIESGFVLLPEPLAADTTYYAFVDPNEPDWVYLATSSANANTRTAIDLTSVGEGRVYLAQTSSLKHIDIADMDCSFTNNRIFISRLALQALSGTQTVASIIGAANVGGNIYETDLNLADGEFRVYYAGNRTICGPDTYYPSDTFAATNVSAGLNFISAQGFVFSGSFDPPAISPETDETVTVTIAGLKTTDIVFVDAAISNQSLIVRRAWVSAADTLSISISNITSISEAVSVNLGSTTFRGMGARIG